MKLLSMRAPPLTFSCLSIFKKERRRHTRGMQKSKKESHEEVKSIATSLSLSFFLFRACSFLAFVHADRHMCSTFFRSFLKKINDDCCDTEYAIYSSISLLLVFFLHAHTYTTYTPTPISMDSSYIIFIIMEICMQFLSPQYLSGRGRKYPYLSLYVYY